MQADTYTVNSGCLPIGRHPAVLLADWGAAFVAMPGHKGLYGPQGTGLLLCGAEASPLLYGGTGSASRRQTMPIDLPDRLEAGTHNMPGIAGLLEGLRFVSHAGVERIAQWERRLTRRAEEGLARLPGVEVFADKTGQGQTGVLSFCVKGMDCEQVGEELARAADRRAGRAALCAPGSSHCRNTGIGNHTHQPIGFQYGGTDQLLFAGNEGDPAGKY